MKMTVCWKMNTTNMLHVDCDKREKPGLMLPIGVYSEYDAVLMCVDCSRYTLFIGTDNNETQILDVLTPAQLGRVDGDGDND